MTTGSRLAARWPALAAGVLAALSVAACSSGGGGGGGGPSPPTTPPPPARMLSWTAAAEPGAQTIYLDIRGLGDPDHFVLQVRANDVTDLYGVALDVVYPADLVTLDLAAVVEGGFFSAGGGFATEFQIVEQPAGRIVIGNSRLGPVGGRNGNGLILELPFDSTASGSGDFAIEKSLAIDSDGQQVATTWLGGTVEIQR
ncbi:MAG: cohesin domain-containing protein [Acidobacteriota bacterium]|nr:cohesin domain-containing protein [Acidobacteriota bacterium]MDH3524879.1 cohesin domain-containing protein [Acidobacteriota bacterium]